MKDGTVAVLMGGSSSERDISLTSGHEVLKALKARGYQAFPLDIRDQRELLLSGEYQRAYIALHGRHGEDGCIQGMLEIMRIPYTGSGVLASSATMDKAFAKLLMATHGIKTPEFEILKGSCVLDGEIRIQMDYPLIVKPSSEGSTFGIKRVDSEKELRSAIKEAFCFGDKIVIERFVEGREVTVGIVDDEVFPIVEVVPKDGFYDFDAKYTKGMTEYIVPAVIGDEMSKKVSETARRVFNLFGCRGPARVDIIIDNGEPQVLEINTVPGMTETSLLPMAAGAAGICFDELVERVLDGATLDYANALDSELLEQKEGLNRHVSG